MPHPTQANAHAHKCNTHNDEWNFVEFQKNQNDKQPKNIEKPNYKLTTLHTHLSYFKENETDERASARARANTPKWNAPKYMQNNMKRSSSE